MPKEQKFYRHKPMGKAPDFLQEREYFSEEESFSGKDTKRVILPWVIIVLIFCALGYRLFVLQVREGFVNLKLAEGNRVKSIPVAGARGLITDSKGNILASNVASYELITRITRTKDLEKVDQTIFTTIGMSKDEVKDEIKKQSQKSSFIILKQKLSREEALIIKSKLPVYGEFEIAPTFLREYIEPSLCHVLGYVGKISDADHDKNPVANINGIVGKSGVEKVYDDFVQGNPGSHKAEVDASNKLVRLLKDEDPKIGKTLKTSINKDLQKFAYERLKQEADDKQTQAALVAIDPRNGGIIAMVSLPLYDSNKLSSGITKEDLDGIFNNKSKPFLNRVITGVYPSGSTIKPFVATSALEAGIVNEDTAFETPPFIEIGQWKFPDWKDHGLTDIKTAIAQSNNIFFYALGGGYAQSPIKKGLGPDGMKKGLEKFGFGKPTGIDLTSEEEGFLPTPEWKKRTTGESWYIGNTYNMAIGQGDLLATPLQIATATSAIANGGRLYRPFVVSEITDSDGNKIDNPLSGEKLVSEGIFSANSLRIVKEGMRKTTQLGGSAFGVFGTDFPLEVAAKTGTAQFGNEEKTHAWFTSFAPYNDPQIAVTVIVEGAGEGYEAAAPVAKDVLKWWSENK
jgi:penicillin-binding protein 2